MKLDSIIDMFRKKPGVADVLSALERFAGDQKTLADLGAAAGAFFGSGWRFNLEMYVGSMPAADRERYAPLVERALAFDRALALWLSATRIVKGAKSLSPEVIKDLPEYEEYLPRFGIEGARLLERLKRTLGLARTPAARDGSETAAPAPAPEKILKKVSREDLEGGVFARNPAAGSAPAPGTAAPAAKPDAKTPEPVRRAEPEPNSARAEPGPEPAAADSAPAPIPEAPAPLGSGGDWDIENFLRVQNFLASSREVMSAVVLDGGYKSLEDYPHYGFILDALRGIVASGEKILSSKSDAAISGYFGGGRKELEDLLDFHRRQVEAEIVPDSAAETEAAQGYVRVNAAAAKKPK